MSARDRNKQKLVKEERDALDFDNVTMLCMARTVVLHGNFKVFKFQSLLVPWKGSNCEDCSDDTQAQ